MQSRGPNSGRGHALRRRASIVAGCLLAASGWAIAQDGPQGITTPTVFAPFDSKAPACRVPQNLMKVLGFAQDNEREFMQGVRSGLASAARDRGLEYRVALANNDPVRMIEQVKAFQVDKMGALVAAPVDPASLSRSLQEIIWSGGYVGTVVPPPATSLLNAPQYLTGKTLGDAAAAYIKEKLGGKANVVLLTHDSPNFWPRASSRCATR